MIKVSWAQLKQMVDSNGLSINWVRDDNSYSVNAFNGPIEFLTLIPILDPQSNDQLDFENNYKDRANKKNIDEVVTQYELNDKTLKLARAKGEVDINGTAILYFKVPGQFGSGQGRYVVGGYGISEDYNKDDYVIARVEDKDRILAIMVAQGMDPNATDPLPDEVIQQMGLIPGIGEAFPSYPMIRSYTDEEAPEDCKGWYFWPLAQGNNLLPIGEVEVNPIGGYGFIPAGFYVKLIYQRPEGVITGALRANIDWGRKE